MISENLIREKKNPALTSIRTGLAKTTHFHNLALAPQLISQTNQLRLNYLSNLTVFSLFFHDYQSQEDYTKKPLDYQ